MSRLAFVASFGVALAACGISTKGLVMPDDGGNQDGASSVDQKAGSQDGKADGTGTGGAGGSGGTGPRDATDGNKGTGGSGGSSGTGGTGGTGGTAGSGGSGGTGGSVVPDAAMEPDAPQPVDVAPDKAAADAAHPDSATADAAWSTVGYVACGQERCATKSSFCCAGVKPACVEGSGSCDGARRECDGPEDCADGEICCAQSSVKGTYSATCMKAGACQGTGAQICHTDKDCTKTCCPLGIAAVTLAICSDTTACQ